MNNIKTWTGLPVEESVRMGRGKGGEGKGRKRKANKRERGREGEREGRAGQSDRGQG